MKITVGQLKKKLSEFDDDQELKIVGQSGIEWNVDNIDTFKDSETVRIKLK